MTATSQVVFPSLKAPLKFYAVVPTAAWVKTMLEAGVDTVQLRAKNLPQALLRQEIQLSVDYARTSESQLFINDYWQLAIEFGAYGVHLGQEDMTAANLASIADAGLRLGLSTHSAAEILRALAVRPSYVACGAVFTTTTKPMPTAPLGLKRLEEMVSLAKGTPTVAIGGIDLTNAAAVLQTGVSSLAVVRAVIEAANPAQVVKDFQRLWTDATELS